jgi:hypothetical protein
MGHRTPVAIDQHHLAALQFRQGRHLTRRQVGPGGVGERKDAADQSVPAKFASPLTTNSCSATRRRR